MLEKVVRMGYIELFRAFLEPKRFLELKIFLELEIFRELKRLADSAREACFLDACHIVGLN